MDLDYFKGINGAVTVSDVAGVVLYQNDRTVNGDVTGKNMRECHKPESLAKIDAILANKTTNVYTIEKRGIKKIIYQSPWYSADSTLGGLVEITFEIPFEMPHFIRSPPPPTQ